MNLWLIVVLLVAIALYVAVSLAGGKKTTVKRDYRSNETVKEAGKCLLNGSVNLVKGIWLIGGFVCTTIIDGWKAVFAKEKKLTGKQETQASLRKWKVKKVKKSG